MITDRRRWMVLCALIESLLAVVLDNTVLNSPAATAISLNFFAMAGVYFFMSVYLQNVRGYSPLHAGLLATPVAIGQLVAASRSAPLVRSNYCRELEWALSCPRPRSP